MQPEKCRSSQFLLLINFRKPCCRFCSVDCWREAEGSYHPWECGLRETVSDHVRQSRVLHSFPEYFRLGFRLLARNLPAATVDQIDRLLLLTPDLKQTPQQKEADFESLFSLCSGSGDGSLEKEFWLFIIVLFYMEVLRRKRYFEGLEEERRQDMKDKMATLLFKIIKVGK